jgi:2-polyprenyl-3-methyl-5-hydroxy-6-metoxy-1,4-benzoquinol methylase
MDETKFAQFAERFAGDLGTLLHGVTVVVGERLGLYAALADSTPTTASELARRTGVDERYVREWLAAQAAAEYVEYDPAHETFRLPEEHAAALVEGKSPLFVPGAFLLAASLYKDEPAIVDAYRSGNGLGWHQHHHDLFTGTEKFFRPGYVANLTSSWVPALDGVEEKLRRGARIADVGCGLGASTIILAQAYPNSTVVGSDYHEPSIELARKAAADAGVADRVTFEVAPAKAFTGTGFDLVAMFDCLHDMGDPVGAAAHVRGALAPDGTWLLVEPMAGERLEDNLNPVGKIFYSASSTICTPASRAQEVGLALGAQASEEQLAAIATEAGFTRFRRATETPFNRVLEIRP